MNISDPVSDLLARLRNALSARHEKADVPSSRFKVELARILKDEGYIKNFKVMDDRGGSLLRLYLKYDDTGNPGHPRPDALEQARPAPLRRQGRASRGPRRPRRRHRVHLAGSPHRSRREEARRRRRGRLHGVVRSDHVSSRSKAHLHSQGRRRSGRGRFGHGQGPEGRRRDADPRGHLGREEGRHPQPRARRRGEEGQGAPRPEPRAPPERRPRRDRGLQARDRPRRHRLQGRGQGKGRRVQRRLLAPS